MTGDLPHLLLAWGIQATGVLSPGPGVALILGVAMAEGRRPALLTCLGIGAGALLLAVLTALGLAGLLAGTREAMIAVRWIGAAYLAWLAIGAFRKAAAPAAPVAARPVARRTPLRRIVGGFVFQIGNPKAILFWLAVAAVGGLDTVSPAALLIFLAGAFAISAGGHGLWALILSSGPARAVYARARRGIEATLGFVFALTAIRLATTKV
ncbi:Homoserine/homoserine lactone efflux protein [Roseivivax jejudonensis]|uniref:Homoserine/homoserine lactone efflux protein n=1 Tax=Roseivivax jejudonensis TaxID=1529041 RepID=A0A1X6YAY4_9RHOB|nr:LysE family transporter [Roseivivax jejudonensis]SLN15151.1 Homoserine/homoserine lactone efflux protein [Roseivivax jejudonensis]